MADFGEPRPVKRNLLLSTALFAVPLIAGIAIVNDALPTGRANAAVSQESEMLAAVGPTTSPVEVADTDTDTDTRRGPSPNALIDATFAALPEEDRGSAVAADRVVDATPQATEVAAIEDEPEPLPPGLSAVRKVRTTPIKVVPTENGLSAIPDTAGPTPPAPIGTPERVAGPAPLVAPEPQTVEVAALDVPVATPPAVEPDPVEVTPAPRAERPKAEAKATPSKGVRVGRQAVNARSGPSKSAGKAFVVDAGEQVKATETVKGWVHITDADGRKGWVYSDFLVGVNTKALPVGDAPSKPASAEREADPVRIADVSDPGSSASGTLMSTEHINVRAEPNKTGSKLFVLAPDQQVTVKATSRGWSQIVTADGRSGWIYANVK